jgi:arabinogalactan endo-1,4-beta-galactosidase
MGRSAERRIDAAVRSQRRRAARARSDHSPPVTPRDRVLSVVFLSVCVLSLSLACRGAESGPPGARRQFVTGADISMLPEIEHLGGVFRENGARRDCLDIMEGHGCTCFRVRLFVNPDHRGGVVNDLPYTLALAGRIKAAGMTLLLDLHYSDTWADPGHQTKPAAWSGLDFPALERMVENYTEGVIIEFKKRGVLPDIVQIGNEVTSGMLWPDGRLGGSTDTTGEWDRFARLLKAGIRGVKAAVGTGETVRIMIHIDRGGDRRGTAWFFDHLARHGVPFDIIGLSYYPWWHGPLAALRGNLAATARAYRKDVMIVETAYPYRGEEWWKERGNMAWPISPDGQRAFLGELVRTVELTPDGCGAGVLYWYPESIPVEELEPWEGGALALFDAKGNALPAIEALRVRAPAGDDCYRLSASRDGWIAGVTAAVAAGALVVGSSNEALTVDDVARLTRGSVNRFDRSATYKFSEGISDASWVVAGAAIAAPFALFLDARVRADWERVVVMYTETMALGVALPAVAKSGAQRIRPFVYNPDVPLDKKLDLDPKGSFFSRHTTLAFASAVFLCTAYDDYRPGSKARPYLWTGALLAAAGVGAMRYEAGQHFPTDIIVGAVVGSALGYGIPRLHHPEKNGVSIAPFASGSCVGVALRWKL